MTVEDMRGWVSSAYKTKSWKTKVSKMPDNQILALYSKFIQQGKITNCYYVIKDTPQVYPTNEIIKVKVNIERER